MFRNVFVVSLWSCIFLMLSGCERAPVDVDIDIANVALVSPMNALGCSSVQVVDFCTTDDDCNPGGDLLCRARSTCEGFTCTVPDTLPQRTACSVDGTSGLCDGASGCCVTCIDSSDCALGESCGSGGCEECVDGAACGSCPAARRIWRTVDTAGECVECVDSDDCPNSSQTCESFQCVFPAGPVCSDCSDLDNGEIGCEQGQVATSAGEEEVIWDGNNYHWSCILLTEIAECSQCTCQPLTEQEACTDRGIECGQVDNGCAPPGLNCGGCPNGESCYFGQCEPTIPAPVCESCDNLLSGEIGCAVGLPVDREWNDDDGVLTYTWSCVTENNSPANCGSCGCHALDASEACDGTECGPVSDGCNALIDCGGCGQGETCQTGICTEVQCGQELWSPPRHEFFCGDEFEQTSNCANIRTAEGTVCPNGLLCENGACVVDPGCVDCEIEQACIDSNCVDIPSCEGVTCGPNETCFRGECRANAPCENLTCDGVGEICVVDQNGVALCDCADPGQRNCGQGCIDILDDEANCGGCGRVCSLECVQGTCAECNSNDDCTATPDEGKEYICVTQTRTCEQRDIQCAPNETLVGNDCVPACGTASDCADDGDPCTESICEQNICKTTDAPDGTICSNAGQGDDQCLAGECVDCVDDDGCESPTTCNSENACGGCINDGDCDDDRSCTTDTCASDGTCTHESTCDEDEFCTENGCVECEDNSNCNDDNTCTTDTCNDDGVCEYTPITCPGGEQICQNGSCPQCSTNSDCDNEFDLCTDNICEDGSCVYPDIDCGDAICDSSTGQCVECRTDGDCGTDFSCSSLGRCEESISTGPDELVCNGQVVNRLIDPNNCGNCGTACQVGASCINGVCDNTFVGPEPTPPGCGCDSTDPRELFTLMIGLSGLGLIRRRRVKKPE